LSAAAPAADAAPPPKPRRRRPWRGLLTGVGVLVLALVALAAILRFGAVTPWGRSLLEQMLDGVQVGSYGRLHVEGLDGDVWQDFTVRRLTIDDGHGAWLEGRSLRMRWDWPQLLLNRHLEIEDLEGARLILARQPVTHSTSGAGGSSISLHIGKLAVKVEMLPAFSSRYGVYDVSGTYDLRQGGGMAGKLSAVSETRVGDRADADFDLGRDKTIRLMLKAEEADGGALAGALGLAADQPFFLDATASGTISQGQFQVTSRSGGAVPVEGQGSWTPQGGSAHGQVTMASTRFLSSYEHMAGPQARFVITGAKAPDGLYNINLTATSDNIDLTAIGEADLGKRLAGPHGLALNVIARKAQPVIRWPAAGGGHFSGVLTGSWSEWDAKGPVVIETPNALAYHLANVHGPLELLRHDGQVSLKATLDGVGGGGGGLLPALLGPSPHATGELAFLPGGHLLVRSLYITGPGLNVQATGDRTLLSGLQFKGHATFTNFGLAHAGARGVLTANWSAGQYGDEPWKVNFDTTAKDIASGYPELDRLLGPAPTLTGNGTADGRGFQVANAVLNGVAGQVTGVGLIGSDASLAMKLGWRAKGPFEVGPLEIAGAAEGSGALSGYVLQPRADLAATFASIDLPELTLTDAHVTVSLLRGPADTNGAFTLAASSPYGPAKASTGFRFIGDGLELTNLDADAGGAHALGDVALHGEAPSSANLTVTVGPGAFLTRGEASGHLLITQAPGGARADLKLTATNAMTRAGDIVIQKASLSANGPLSQMPYQVQASGLTPHGSWSATGSGVLDGEQDHYAATFSGAGRLRNADFHTIQPASVRFDHGTGQLSVAADVGGGQAKVDASQTPGAFQAKATLTNVSLGLLDQDFTGRFDANVSLQGQGQSLSGALDARLASAGERGASGEPTLNGEVKGTLASNIATIDASLGNGQGLTSQAHLVLPAETSAAPFRIDIVRTAPMHGTFSADGEIKPLWDLVMGGERGLAGQVHARATLGGTLADPQASGEASIANGKFSDSATGLKLTGVTLAAQMNQDAVDVSQFAGQDGDGGSVTGSGRFSLQRAGDSSFKLDFQHFRLIDNDLATAAATGQAMLSRAADGSVKLTGALTIDRADIAANPPTPSGVTPMDVTEINREPGTGGHLTHVDAKAPAVALDVTLKAVQGVFIKGRGLNVELSLNAHVTGSTAAPELTGIAQVVHGDYDFAGKRFEFDNRSTVRLDADPKNIRLDLTATRDDPTLTAMIHIEGTADVPKITLSSTPTLPPDEVLSQVLFGSSTSQLSPFDAAELASAVASLRGGGSGFDVLGNLKTFAHLDRLALGGGPGMAVSGGKYITDRIYLEVGGGPAGPQGSVEWRVQKNLSVVSKLVGEGGDSQLEVRWRKDY
jgi:translocation and assembly module TamB